MSARWIVSLYVVVRIFGFVDAVAMNSIATTIELRSRPVRVIGIRENVEIRR